MSKLMFGYASLKKDPPEAPPELCSCTASGSVGPEPGFLYSEGMSGGTGLWCVPPWEVYPHHRNSKGSGKISPDKDK